MVNVKEITEGVVKVLNELDTHSETIRKYLVDHSSRLVHLLWGNTDEYEGPLFDGLQKNEWSIITVLVGNWVMEVYTDVLKDKDVLRDDILMFFSKQYLANFCFSLLKGIVKSGLVPGAGEDALKSIDLIMRIPAIYKFIEDDLRIVIGQVDDLLNQICCSKSNKKKIIKSIKELSDKQGALATLLNKFKKYKDHELIDNLRREMQYKDDNEIIVDDDTEEIQNEINALNRGMKKENKKFSIPLVI